MGSFSKIVARLHLDFLHLVLLITLTVTIGLMFFGVLDFPGCPFSELLDICCPMCGTTRAWKSFLSGNVIKAFHYNPIFLLWGFWCSVFYLDLWCKTIKMKRPTIGEWLLQSLSNRAIFSKLHLLMLLCMFIYLNFPLIKQWRELGGA